MQLSVYTMQDGARSFGLEEVFLPLRIAAEREGLFEYPGLFVAEAKGSVVGFAACSEDELAGCTLMFLCFAAA